MRRLFIMFFYFLISVFALDLKLNIENIKSNKGNIKIAIFREGSDFPNDYNSAEDSAVVQIVDLKAKHTFKNLRLGEYAIAIFHDLNSNEELDINFLGVPIEPFGLSNNPILLGPPTFKKCKFYLSTDDSQVIKLKKIF